MNRLTTIVFSALAIIAACAGCRKEPPATKEEKSEMTVDAASALDDGGSGEDEGFVQLCQETERRLREIVIPHLSGRNFA